MDRLKTKQYWIFSILLLLLLVVFCSCEEKEPANKTDLPIYTVTFDSQGGTAVAEQKIVEGEQAKEPIVPTREGYVFDCWKNGKTGRKWNFSVSCII